MIKPYTIILGATGSVGRQAIDVIQAHNKKSKKKIQIVGLANFGNQESINELANQNNTKYVFCKTNTTSTLEDFIVHIKEKYGSKNLNALNAISGFDGLEASLILAKHSIDTLLANKESIVAGGNVYLDCAKKQKIKVVPVDSEHSALYSLLKAHKSIKNVIITASGGPFRDRNQKELDTITPAQASCHPNWKMGKKISIDSATLANKVLEVIEAKYLFGLRAEQIKVVINRQSVVHSFVEMKNNSLFAELSTPDMKLPISKALGLKNEPFIKPLDFSALRLDFSQIDTQRFKFLTLKDKCLENLRNSIIFNASNEVAVKAFEDGKIKFTDIFYIVKAALDSAEKIYSNKEIKIIDEIYKVDKLARDFSKTSCF